MSADTATARVIDWLRRHAQPSAPALFSLSREDAQRLVDYVDGLELAQLTQQMLTPPAWAKDPGPWDGLRYLKEENAVRFPGTLAGNLRQARHASLWPNVPRDLEAYDGDPGGAEPGL